MTYKEIIPCTSLTPFIHSYWELKGEGHDEQWERIFPDGCQGLVISLGDSCITDNGSVSVDFGKSYITGTMTSFKDSFIKADTHLFGVCLKPAAFSNFYTYAPQSELKDKTVQLEKAHSFDINKLIKEPAHYLNAFFTNRLQHRNQLLQNIISDIHLSKGQLSISTIAQRNFLTARQLERNFRTHVGITPKEYSRIIRFQHALSRIKESGKNKSLPDIAFECGYYDPSHLANEIKRNTGLTASQL